jgi:hypothetical protein
VGAILFLVCAATSQAGFIGYYAPDNFSLVNNNADGFVTTPGDGSSITITGGNNGSGLEGTTDFLITAPDTGLVTFRYLFTSLDGPDAEGVFPDVPGFVVNDNFMPFSQLLSTDPVFSLAFVSAGDQFGFRVYTYDNTGEPGILTISDFIAPQPPEAPAPEPNLGIALGAALAAGAAWRIRREVRNRKETA